ncbi:alanine--tRNA ligase [Candidatus Omnitrophota bacterium]
MTTNELRSQYLSFFNSRKHKLVASDSLIPKDDPTLLFTSAGMNQFKDYFLALKKDITRATSCQKCLRTGDLERVGKTPYHHTFFEMLGNFSFGDYFKEDTIQWAWEFLTKNLNLKEKDLWVSVYQDDDDAYTIWKKRIGVAPERICRFGAEDNFWPANALIDGPNGPCGPCSEIFFDWGKDKGCGKTSCDPSCACGRFVEIWNLVFTQFNRTAVNQTEPLPAKNIDTGMGLERMSSVLQGKPSNFEIDILAPIVKDVGVFVRTTDKILLHAMADHVRAVTFAIGDGIYPTNDDRGYVIRRILRRALWFAFSCGQKKPFLHKIVGLIAEVMSQSYPGLAKKKDVIAKVIQAEEERFLATLDKGRGLLFSCLTEAQNTNKNCLSGETAFKLYDTYGFPYELTKGIVEEKGLDIDHKAFEALLEEQRASSRQKSKFKDTVFANDTFLHRKTPFIGYAIDAGDEEGLAVEVVDVSTLKEDGSRALVLKETPFYPESGGQLYDTGVIKGYGGKQFLFEVIAVTKIGESIVHKGTFTEGDIPDQTDYTIAAKAYIDSGRRAALARAHTSTHLLQAALRKVLGEHVQQQGSLVDEDSFRFDFTHFKGLTPQELSSVEEEVNEYIARDLPVKKVDCSLNEAKKQGALAFFEEKYEESVRVVSVEGVSKELCGGVHLERTSQAGAFFIISESSISSGIRRIEATCGKKAYAFSKENRGIVEKISSDLKIPANQTGSAVVGLIAMNKESAKINRALRKKVFEISEADRLIKEEAHALGTASLIVFQLKGADADSLRDAIDVVKKRIKDRTIIVGYSQEEGKLSINISCTKDLLESGFSCKTAASDISAKLGGSGGGRDDFGFAGTKEAKGLSAETIKKTVLDSVKERIGS